MRGSGRYLWFAAALVLAPAPALARDRDFDIAEMPAARSIPEFARQAGVQIIAPVDGLERVRTPRIKGRFDVDAALRRLIAGTSLAIVRSDGATIVLRARAAPGPRPVPQPKPALAEPVDPPVIVVTGTRLQPRVAVPPTSQFSISGDEVRGRFGGISFGDQLSTLPSLRPTATQAASTALGRQPSGQVGLNLLDLRGLGPSRTLVLINGRRAVSSTQILSQPSVDTIPLPLLERVDVLTGGVSAVYGADAIAGVVNFVLRRDVDGLSVDAQAGISERGDAGTRQASALFGRNFADGRGNVAIAVGVARRDALRASDRPFAATRADFVANPAAGTPGQPSTIPVRDIRLMTASAGGVLAGSAPALGFAPDGSIGPLDTGTRAFPAIGLSAGGAGADPEARASLLPSDERIYATLIGHREIGDGLTLSGQFDYVRQVAQAAAPSSLITLPFRRDNPLLSAAAGRVIDAASPSGPLLLSRTLDDIALLAERNTRTTRRASLGLRGEVSPSIRFDLFYSYGDTRIIKDNLGNIDTVRLRAGFDAVRDPATGAIRCRTPAPGCVPLDLFGSGRLDAAARQSVVVDTQSTGRFAQHFLSGLISGDTSGFLDLPAGPASFVLGGEFRRETTRYNPDPLDEQGATLVGAQRLVGAIDVFEGYGEARVPLLEDVPVARRLELSGAVRASKYRQLRAGLKITGGANLLYEPVAGLYLRASWQRTMRAPNITELYQPLVTGQADVIDPCDPSALDAGTPRRRQNCQALGLPAIRTGPPSPTRVATVTSGNPNLDVERGRTVTLGIVFEPVRLPGWRLALDFYDVDLRNAIAQPNTASLDGSIIAAGCVDGPSIRNPFCAAISRDPATGAITQIRQSPINLTRLRAQGIDLDARWSARLAPGSRAEFRLMAAYQLAREDFRVAAQPDYATRLTGTPSAPRLQAALTGNLVLGPVALFGRTRFISSVYYRNDDVAFFERVNGLPPVDPDRRGAGFVRTGDTWYHDLRLSASIAGALEVFAGVENLFDTRPPFSFTGAGEVGTQFDPVGRFLYLGVRTSL